MSVRGSTYAELVPHGPMTRALRHLRRRFVAETLMPLILELEKRIAARVDPAPDGNGRYLKDYVAARRRSISPSA